MEKTNKFNISWEKQLNKGPNTLVRNINNNNKEYWWEDWSDYRYRSYYKEKYNFVEKWSQFVDLKVNEVELEVKNLKFFEFHPRSAYNALYNLLTLNAEQEARSWINDYFNKTKNLISLKNNLFMLDDNINKVLANIVFKSNAQLTKVILGNLDIIRSKDIEAKKKFYFDLQKNMEIYMAEEWDNYFLDYVRFKNKIKGKTKFAKYKPLTTLFQENAGLDINNMERWWVEKFKSVDNNKSLLKDTFLEKVFTDERKFLKVVVDSFNIQDAKQHPWKLHFLPFFLDDFQRKHKKLKLPKLLSELERQLGFVERTKRNALKYHKKNKKLINILMENIKIYETKIQVVKKLEADYNSVVDLVEKRVYLINELERKLKDADPEVRKFLKTENPWLGQEGVVDLKIKGMIGLGEIVADINKLKINDMFILKTCKKYEEKNKPYFRSVLKHLEEKLRIWVFGKCFVYEKISLSDLIVELINIIKAMEIIEKPQIQFNRLYKSDVEAAETFLCKVLNDTLNTFNTNDQKMYIKILLNCKLTHLYGEKIIAHIYIILKNKFLKLNEKK